MLETAEFDRAARALTIDVLLDASAPPASLSVAAWVAENLRVPDGPREGQLYDPSLTPYLTEILDRLSPDDPCTRVVVRKSAQVGYTVAAIVGWMGAIVDRIHGRAMIVQPTLTAAKDFARDKLQTAFDATDSVVRKVEPVKSRAGEGSTATFKRFPGGSIVITGANSTADLRMKTIRYVANDEIDEWETDLAGQGDPMRMVDARQNAFRASGEFKKLDGSTPTLTGQSRIDKAFDEGDQRFFEVACPHCGFEQPLNWEQLHYQEEWPHNAEYECAECHALIGHHEKMRMLRAGKWVPRAPGPGRYPSYHLNALYSPFVTWDQMVDSYQAAKDDPLELKTWWNLWKGESFELKGEAPTWQELQKRAERIRLYARGEVPDQALFLTAGVDVQQNRLEVVIVGWGVGRTSYRIDRIVIEGDTSDLGVWARLTELWAREWHTVSGRRRMIEMMAVDAGYRPEMVYNWVRGKESAPRGEPRAMAVKGENRQTDWVLGGPRKVEFTLTGKTKRGTAMRYPVGSHAGKVSLYGRLNLDGPNEAGQFPPGFCHAGTGFDDDFYQQQTAEMLVPVKKRGGRVDYEWRLRARQRNEVLDCEVYAHAGAVALGMDRLRPEDWLALAEERTACAPDKGQLDMLAAVVAPAGAADQKSKDPRSLAARLAGGGQ